MSITKTDEKEENQRLLCCVDSGGSPTAISNGVHGYHVEDASPTSSAPGSKMRSLFTGAVRPRSKSDLTAFVNCPAVTARSYGSHQCTYVVQSETVDSVFASNGESESSTSSSSDGGCRSRGSSGDSGLPSSSGSGSRLSQSLNVYRTSGMPSVHGSTAAAAAAARYRRCCSVRDDPPPIGPTEFVEMFRSRAYSDPRLLDRTRWLAEHRRQLSMSPPAPTVSGSWSGTGAFEPRQMIIWKDPQKGTSVFRLPSTDEEDYLGVGPFEDSADQVFLRFLKTHSCYDVMPTSNKMVVLDTQLNVKKAFYALVNNGIRAAPLWDADQQTVTGMFTITDFIKILLKYHRTSQFDMEDIEDHTIASWSELLSECCSRRLVTVGPYSTMIEAIRTLCLNRVHRLPVIDPLSGNILYLLTHRRLLHYIYYFFKQYGLSQPSFLEKTVGELAIGTFGRIASVRLDTPLVVALELFLSYRVSSLPVVDSGGRLVSFYAKADVVNLAAEKTYANLTETLGQVLNSSRRSISDVTCTRNESLRVVVDRIVENQIHRVFVLDDAGCVEGVVSLSDILRRLVLSTSDDMKDGMDADSPSISDQLVNVSDD